VTDKRESNEKKANWPECDDRTGFKDKTPKHSNANDKQLATYDPRLSRTIMICFDYYDYYWTRPEPKPKIWRRLNKHEKRKDKQFKLKMHDSGRTRT
jgi:hypothetical protein